MALKDWIGLPPDWGPSRHQIDDWLKKLVSQTNTNITDIATNLAAIALNTAHRERQEPSNGYLWESDTTTEYFRVQGEQGGSSNRIRFTVEGDGDSGEAFEFYWGTLRFMLVSDTDVIIYGDDGSTEVFRVEMDNDWVGLRVARTAVTLGTSITQFGGAYANGSYMVANDGRVQLEGLLKNSTGGNITNPYTVASIPSAYAPTGQLVFNQSSGASPPRGRVDVDTSGNIIWKGTNPLPNNQYLSLSGMGWYI